jgi:DNA-directed RNA polymerase specialized sigma24 family protein
MMEARLSTRRMRVAEAYEDLRSLLFSIAYRMLGSVAEAEDIVQESSCATNARWPSRRPRSSRRGHISLR